MNRRGFLAGIFPSLALMAIGPSCLTVDKPTVVGWTPEKWVYRNRPFNLRNGEWTQNYILSEKVAWNKVRALDVNDTESMHVNYVHKVIEIVYKAS